MLSRVAENLYWMSRNIERAENIARLLGVGFDLELDAAGLARDVQGDGPIERALTILACRDAFERACPPGGRGRDAVLRFLTFETRHPQSITGMIARARENARGAQESISAEAWSHVNRLYLYLSGPKAQRQFAASPFRFYERVKQSCILFDGLIDSTLPRNEVFHFLQLGRHLERVDQISRIIHAESQTLHAPGTDTGTGPEAEAAPPLRLVHWTSLLQTCSAYEAYLRTYHDRIDPLNVVRYLVLDPDFPRTVRFCVMRCRESLHEISGGDIDGYGSEAERRLGRLDGELRYIDVGEIFERGLSSYLRGLQEACVRIGEEIHHTYFDI
jgi:uncharacterized alpha-E superfamily protein